MIHWEAKENNLVGATAMGIPSKRGFYKGTISTTRGVPPLSLEHAHFQVDGSGDVTRTGLRPD